jgi:glycosyltransferase involved in cell wall biosynthesis
MIDEKPLLSIAIPTKNRQYYCIEAIKHILSYDNQDFELCIHDHSDDRTIEQFVSTIEDNRLKYIYTTEAIASSENMSRSIEMTHGEYICMIGDDDTILPTIFKWAKYMKKNGVDSICPGYRPEYFWPNEETGNKGTLKIVKYRNTQEIEKVNPMERLEKLFEDGILDFPEYSLPRVYHGLVKKMVLDNIYQKMDTYFAGLSPDIYSAVSLSALVKNHIVIKETISILGACPISTTSKGRLNSDDGKFENTPHLKNNANYQWDALIPKYYCGEIIWAETAITASKDFNLYTVLKKFNRKLFNNIALTDNRHITEIIMKAYFENINKKNNRFNRSVYLTNSYIYQGIDFIKRAYRKIFLKKTFVYKNIEHIEQAVKKFQ